LPGAGSLQTPQPVVARNSHTLKHAAGGHTSQRRGERECQSTPHQHLQKSVVEQTRSWSESSTRALRRNDRGPDWYRMPQTIAEARRAVAARHALMIVNVLPGTSRRAQDYALDETPSRFRKAPGAPRSDAELLLRIDVAAERLAVSRATLYRMVQRGEIPTVRIGTAVRVPVSALERWLAGQMAGQGGAR
jgi:excisionase family DNA binding protein